VGLEGLNMNVDVTGEPLINEQKLHFEYH